LTNRYEQEHSSSYELRRLGRSKDTVMTTLHTLLVQRRSARAHRRDDRALERAIATAPTLDSAHEIAALAAHR
jgi:hypothetical protein